MIKSARVVAYEFKLGPEGIKVSSVAATSRGTRYLFRSAFAPNAALNERPPKEVLVAAMKATLARS